MSNRCPCCFRKDLELIKTQYTDKACCKDCELMIRKMLYVGTNGRQKVLTKEEIETLPKE